MRLNVITSRDKPGLRQLLLHVQDIGFLIMHSVMFSAFIFTCSSNLSGEHLQDIGTCACTLVVSKYFFICVLLC